VLLRDRRRMTVRCEGVFFCRRGQQAQQAMGQGPLRSHRRVRTDVTLGGEVQPRHEPGPQSLVGVGRRTTDVTGTPVTPPAAACVGGGDHGRRQSITAPARQPQDAMWERLMMRRDPHEVCVSLLSGVWARGRVQGKALRWRSGREAACADETGAAQVQAGDVMVVQRFLNGGVLKTVIR
jgi:hypothetical protein